MDKITEYRNEINLIDNEIKSMLVNRMEIINEIKVYKKENGIKIEDKSREKEILDAISNGLDERYKSYIVSIFNEIIQQSKEYQNN